MREILKEFFWDQHMWKEKEGEKGNRIGRRRNPNGSLWLKMENGESCFRSWVIGNKPPLHERGKPLGAGYLWAASPAGGVMSP